MTEQAILDNNWKAMEQYNEAWKSPYAHVTQRLYTKAAKTERFGCHLQDEVLVRLGATIKNHKTRHYGKDSLAFIRWMTE